MQFNLSFFLGMNNNSFGEGEDMELFALSESTTMAQLREISEIDLLDADRPTQFGDEEGDGDDDGGDDGLIVLNEEMEAELEQDYIRSGLMLTIILENTTF